MAGIRKEHDWFAENLANPSFSNSDFKSVGINASNTSLGPIDVYLQSPEVQRQEVFQTNGRFDQAKVKAYYMNIAKSYNTLANDTYEQDLAADKKAIFSQYNVFVAPERRTQVTPAVLEFQPNPDHTTFGIIGFNTPGKITKTPEELSESQPIWDPDTQTWTKDTPEDSFFKYLTRPTVLATWDYDADINGNPTNDKSKIAYYKGQPKVNANGEYYQEFLNGRSSDGKKLLHKANILTREDSWINQYDPFDNDGFDKSVWGSITSNALKIVPLLVPGVREAYLYTTLGLGAAQALTTLGKMFTGSDNAFLNTASSVMESFSTTTSEYASEHAFSLENVLNMVGDTFEFIKGQRLLAEKAPTWFGGKIPKDKVEFNARVNEMVANKISKMTGVKGSVDELHKALSIEASAQLQQQIQNYQKLGQQISKNYMAITFGTHTYSTAKAQGVSDEAATILTLGAIGGQYALLNSHIGSWIFPEAKMESQEMKLVAKKLIEVRESESFKAAQNSLKTATTTGEKLKSFKDIFKLGKSLANKVYNDPMKTTAQAAVAGSIASGVEMVSFSVLDDIIAQTYNTAQWLRGNNHRMSAWENMGERYLTSFLGGAMAGVMSAKELYKTANTLHSLSPEQAFERLVSIVAMNKTDKFLKELDETTWGNKYLSTEKYATTEEGTDIYKQGTEINNQDKLIKDSVKNIIKIIQQTLETNEALIDPNSVLSNDKTIGLVKASLLQGSVIVKDYLGNLNKKMAELVDVQSRLDTMVDGKERKEEKEIKAAEKDNKSSLPVNELDSLRTRRAELIKELHKYKTGENIPEYMPTAIFDMSPGINNAFLNGNFSSWTETKYKKSFDQLSKEEQLQAAQDYKDWIKKHKSDAVYQSWDLFKRTNSVASEYLGKLKSDGVFEDMDLANTKALKYFLRESSLRFAVTNIKNDGPIDANDLLISESRNFNDNIAKVILKDIIAEINRDPVNRQDAELFENLRVASQNEEYADSVEELNNFIDSLEFYVYKNRILDAIESDLKDRKYIDPDFKNRLTNILQDQLGTETLFRTLFLPEEDGLSNSDAESLFNNYDVAKISSFESFYDRLMKDFVDPTDQKAVFRENNTLSLLNKVQDFDLLDTISKFGKSITKENFDLARLFKEIETVFEKNQETVDKFFLGQDKLNQIELGLLVLDMFKSHTIAANNVVDSINNVYGYNVTVNSMIKDSNLTVLEPKHVASQLQTIHMLTTRLKYFKKLAEFARANKFNEIANVENSFRVTLYNRIKDKLDKIPESWKGVEELKSTIDGLVDLNNLSQSKFTSLSPEAQTKLIKDYTNYEQAIHDFFQKNSDKIQNVDNLKEFLDNFELEGTLVKKSISDSDFNDDRALVWYLASLAALDPKQFYSNLMKSDIGNVALTFSRMTQANLLASKIFNKPVFDKFVEAYNKSIDNKLMTEAHDDYKFDFRRIKFTNTTFLSSGAGAGKSFAILPLAINFIRQVDPKLLNNCWVASTSPVYKDGSKNVNDNSAAVKLKQAWKLNSKDNAFTKEQLMKMISNDWHESLNDKLELEVNDKDIEVDEEKGIVKYNFKLRQYDKKDLPDIIIIDEIADYSELDMELIDRFAQENDINVIVAGDLEQVGLVGNKEITVKNSKIDNRFALEDSQFIHTFYNTANYRTENSLQDKNIAYDRVMQTQTVGTESIKIPAYEYYLHKDKGLYGRKVFGRKETIDTQKEYIDMLVRTRTFDKSNKEKNKIGYVYDSEESEIYKYINENYRDSFDFFYRYPLKGEEAQYYVFDLYEEPSNADRTTLIKNLYTVFTRSKQGTIFIKPVSSRITESITSKQVNYVTVAGLDFTQLTKYSEAISKILNEVYPELVKIDTTKKAKNDSESNKEESKKEESKKEEEKTNEPIDTPEEQKELKADQEDTQENNQEEPIVENDNVVFKASGFDDSQEEITLVDLPENPVDDQIVQLNNAVTPVVKNFMYNVRQPFSILLSNGKHVKFNIQEVFNLGLYTRFNNLTGLVRDADLGFKVSEGADNRIDNYYGLQNLFKLLNINTRSTEQYTLNNDAEHNREVKRNVQRFLQNIRELNYRIADRQELEKEIYSLIKNTFGQELKNPFIRFIWESTNYKSNKGRFTRRKNETPDDQRLTFGSAKSISVLIGSEVNGEDKILTTVSLAKLPHWRTVIRNTGEATGAFLRELLVDIENETSKTISKSDPNYDYQLRLNYLKELENILLGTSTRKYSLGVASLYHLLKIYNFNHEGIAYIDKGTGAVDYANVSFKGSRRSLDQDMSFTLAKYFETTGPFVFANERTGDVIDDINVNVRSSDTDTAEYIDIREYVNSGQYTISPILVTKEEVKSASGTTLVSPGRPFVLVGESSLQQSELFSTYAAQAIDNKLPIRVKRVYLKNPESNFEDYMNQLFKWTKNKTLPDDIKNIPLIGNDLVSYRILKHLNDNYSNEFNLGVKQASGDIISALKVAFEGTFDDRIESISPEILNLFERTKDMSTMDILRELKKESSYRKMTYGRLLNLTLRILIDPRYVGHWYNGSFYNTSLPEIIKQYIKSEQESGNLKTIFYNIRFDGRYTDQDINGTTIYRIKTDTVEDNAEFSYTLDGKPFTTNIIMTPILIGDLFPLITKISNSIKYEDGKLDGAASFSATGAFVNDNARPNENKPTSKKNKPSISVRVNKSEAVANELLQENQEINSDNIDAVRKQFLEKGYPAFKLGETHYFLTVKPGEASGNKIISINVRPGLITVQYDGPNQVKLLLTPKTRAGRVTFTAQIERKMIERTVQDVNYFDTLLKYESGELSINSEDTLAKEGVRAINEFKEEFLDSNKPINPEDLEYYVGTVGYKLGDNGQIELNKENFMIFLEEVFDSNLKEELQNELKNKKEETSRETEKIIKDNCNLNIKF